MSRYDDMLNLKRPESKRQKMSIQDRAKIFSPFMPLKPYDAAAKSKEFRYETMRILPEEEQTELNLIVQSLQKGEVISATYFVQDKMDGDIPVGHYEKITGAVSGISIPERRLRIVRTELDLSLISEIQRETKKD